MAKENEVDRNAALNDAAKLFLSVLPEQVQEMLLETAATTLHIPLWMLLAGLIQQSCAFGQHNEPLLDPAWTRNAPVETEVYEPAICQYGPCGREFRPGWPRQNFCSNLCGSVTSGTSSAGGSPDISSGGNTPWARSPKVCFLRHYDGRTANRWVGNYPA